MPRRKKSKNFKFKKGDLVRVSFAQYGQRKISYGIIIKNRHEFGERIVSPYLVHTMHGICHWLDGTHLKLIARAKQ